MIKTILNIRLSRFRKRMYLIALQLIILNRNLILVVQRITYKMLKILVISNINKMSRHQQGQLIISKNITIRINRLFKPRIYHYRLIDKLVIYLIMKTQICVRKYTKFLLRSQQKDKMIKKQTICFLKKQVNCFQNIVQLKNKR